MCGAAYTERGFRPIVRVTADVLSVALPSAKDNVRDQNFGKTPEGGIMRMIMAYGLPGYGPDASDDNFRIASTWPDVADELRSMLQESADGEGDSAEMYANSGDYETAWKTRKHADEMYNLADQLNNERQNAPLYKGDPEAWARTIERIVTDNFPYDVNQSCRLYAWEDAEFGADAEEVTT